MESHFRLPTPYLGHRIVYPDTHALNRALWGGGDLKGSLWCGEVRVKTILNPREGGVVGLLFPVLPPTPPPVPFWVIVLCGLEGGEGGPGSELLVGGNRELAPSGAAAC